MTDAILLLILSAGHMAIGADGALAALLFWIVAALALIGFCSVIGWIDRATSGIAWRISWPRWGRI